MLPLWLTGSAPPAIWRVPLPTSASRVSWSLRPRGQALGLTPGARPTARRPFWSVLDVFYFALPTAI